MNEMPFQWYMLSWEWHPDYINESYKRYIVPTDLWRGHYQVTQNMRSITPPSQLHSTINVNYMTWNVGFIADIQDTWTALPCCSHLPGLTTVRCQSSLSAAYGRQRSTWNWQFGHGVARKSPFSIVWKYEKLLIWILILEWTPYDIDIIR